MNQQEHSCPNTSTESKTSLTETRRLIIEAIEAEGVEHPGFYGILSFHFQNGHLTIIRREQTTIASSSKHEEKYCHATSQRY
jgi:hypothetical protein